MVQIRFIDKVCQDQAVSLAAAKGAMSLIERGLRRYGHAWDLPAYAGMVDGVCVGMVLLDQNKHDNTLNVDLAWCDEAHPELLTRLLMRVRTWCREQSISEVTFTCHDENGDMAKAARALEAEPWTHTYRVRL